MLPLSKTDKTDNIINQTRVYFNVYKLSEGLYVNEDICKEYHVGNQEKVRRIKDHICYLVTEEDLETIKQATKDTSKAFSCVRRPPYTSPKLSTASLEDNPYIC